MAAALVAAPLTSGCAHSAAGAQVATAGSRAPTGGQVLPAAGEDERHRQFVSCMHTQGVELASPGAPRREPATTTGPEAERANAALERCRVYLPGGGLPPRPSQQDIEKAIAYAKCVRDNGVPYYPDPDPETGQPRLITELGERLKQDPLMQLADERCRNAPLDADPGGANG